MKLFSLAWPIFIETALFMLLGLVDVFILKPNRIDHDDHLQYFFHRERGNDLSASGSKAAA